jgi:hypothetical protein
MSKSEGKYRTFNCRAEYLGYITHFCDVFALATKRVRISETSGPRYVYTELMTQDLGYLDTKPM